MRNLIKEHDEKDMSEDETEKKNTDHQEDAMKLSENKKE